MKALDHNEFKVESACGLNPRKTLSAPSGKSKERFNVILWKMCKGQSFRHFLAVLFSWAYISLLLHFSCTVKLTLALLQLFTVVSRILGPNVHHVNP